MNRNEAIAWIDEECTNIDPRDKDYVDAMKAIRDLLAARTEVDDEEVKRIIKELCQIGPSGFKGAKLIERLHTKTREQAEKISKQVKYVSEAGTRAVTYRERAELAERQRDALMKWIEKALLKGPWINLKNPGISAAPPHWLRDDAKEILKRIRAMSTTTGEE